MTFPTDDTTLDLLWLSLNPPADSERTSLWDLLDMMSGCTPGMETRTDDPDVFENLHPSYHPNDVIAALITEVRRLRLIDGRDDG